MVRSGCAPSEICTGSLTYQVHLLVLELFVVSAVELDSQILQLRLQLPVRQVRRAHAVRLRARHQRLCEYHAS